MIRHDAIVVGVSGMGSSTVYHLARRGVHMLGLEQFDIPNEMGSSHSPTGSGMWQDSDKISGGTCKAL